MKTTKKLTAILLCFAMLTTLFILPAAADDAPVPTAQPVFLTEDDRLVGVDFSGVIGDESTINTDLLLLFCGADIIYSAQFDPAQKGVVLFGNCCDEVGFVAEPIRTYGVDLAFDLRPAANGENLFDDVDSFRFTAQDAFKNVEKADFLPKYPTAKVTAAEGETVTEMELCFKTGASDRPMLLDSVERSVKELLFSGTSPDTIRTFVDRIISERSGTE